MTKQPTVSPSMLWGSAFLPLVVVRITPCDLEICILTFGCGVHHPIWYGALHSYPRVWCPFLWVDKVNYAVSASCISSLSCSQPLSWTALHPIFHRYPIFLQAYDPEQVIPSMWNKILSFYGKNSTYTWSLAQNVHPLWIHLRIHPAKLVDSSRVGHPWWCVSSSVPRVVVYSDLAFISISSFPPFNWTVTLCE